MTSVTCDTGLEACKQQIINRELCRRVREEVTKYEQIINLVPYDQEFCRRVREAGTKTELLHCVDEALRRHIDASDLRLDKARAKVSFTEAQVKKVGNVVKTSETSFANSIKMFEKALDFYNNASKQLSTVMCRCAHAELLYAQEGIQGEADKTPLDQAQVEFDKARNELDYWQTCVKQGMVQLRVDIESSRSARAKLAHAQAEAAEAFNAQAKAQVEATVAVPVLTHTES